MNIETISRAILAGNHDDLLTGCQLQSSGQPPYVELPLHEQHTAAMAVCPLELGEEGVWEIGRAFNARAIEIL
jgi:hypothetical protein